MTQEIAERPAVQTIRNLLAENCDQFARLLPKIVAPERFLATIVATVQENTDLQECTVQSLVRCVLQSAQLGLMPGPRRQVYLVPFHNNKTKRRECQLIIGYQGLLSLCRNSGMIANVDAQPVYDGDVFEYTIGTSPSIKHVPKSEWRRKIKAEKVEGGVGFKSPESWDHITDFYAWAKLTNGELKIIVLTREEVDYCRDRFSKAGKSGPWRDDFPSMGNKTALRELCNLLPSSEERQDVGTAVTLDKQAEADIPQTLDVPFEIKGLQDEEPQVEKPAPVATLPDFAPQGREHCKGKPVNDPAVRDEDLDWYAKYLENCLKRPDRSQYKATDEHKLAGIRQEQARRETLKGGVPQEQAARQPEPAQEPSKPEAQGKPQAGPTPPPEGYPAGEPEWQTWRMEAEDKYPDLYYEVKGALRLKKAQPIPVERRQEFYRAYGEAKAKG